MPEIRFARLTDIEVAARIDEITALYLSTYSEPPYNADSKYSRQAFLERTRQQMVLTGFDFIAATSDDELIGFTFGFHMSHGGWWMDAGAPPSRILGSSKFAIIELVVSARYRQRGVGKDLLLKLLSERAEQYATLAASPNAPAHGMYIRWGWKIVAKFKSPPHSDAMVLPLKLP